MTCLPRIVSFHQLVDAQISAPDAAQVLAGNPRQVIWNHYSDPSERFFAGVWSSTPGAWRVRYTEHEFCHLLSGRVALASESGERLEFSAGDTFVIPAGFIGVWETIEECRKLYAMVQFSQHE